MILLLNICLLKKNSITHDKINTNNLIKLSNIDREKLVNLFFLNFKNKINKKNEKN